MAETGRAAEADGSVQTQSHWDTAQEARPDDHQPSICRMWPPWPHRRQNCPIPCTGTQHTEQVGFVVVPPAEANEDPSWSSSNGR